MKLTCTSWSWCLLSFEQVIQVMSVLGFKAIDVGAFAGFAHFEPSDLAEHPRKFATDLNEIRKRHGIAFTDLFVTFGNTLIERSVNFPDKVVRESNSETFRKIAEFCKLVEIPGITLSPGVTHDEVGKRASLDLAIEELARLSSLGKQADLGVSFEPHLESITESPQDALQVVRAVPDLGLTLDYSHFVAQGYAQSDVEPLLDFTRHVHVRQSKPGTLQARDDDGTIDFERILTHLQIKSYDGWIAFEYEWNDWQNNNQVDVVSETVLLKRRFEKFQTHVSTGT